MPYNEISEQIEGQHVVKELIQKILNHPENQGILPYSEEYIILDLKSVDKWNVGTHPDLLEAFWELGKKNARGTDPRAIVGSPALVHPTSGIVYGFVGGTYTHVLRLPPNELEEARKQTGEDPSSEDAACNRYGEKWSQVETWHHPKTNAWHLAAYDYASK